MFKLKKTTTTQEPKFIQAFDFSDYKGNIQKPIAKVKCVENCDELQEYITVGEIYEVYKSTTEDCEHFIIDDEKDMIFDNYKYKFILVNEEEEETIKIKTVEDFKNLVNEVLEEQQEQKAHIPHPYVDTSNLNMRNFLEDLKTKKSFLFKENNTEEGKILSHFYVGDKIECVSNDTEFQIEEGDQFKVIAVIINDEVYNAIKVKDNKSPYIVTSENKNVIVTTKDFNNNILFKEVF